MGCFQGQSDKNKIQAKATYNGIPQTQFDNIMIREYKPLEGPAISRNDIAEICYRKKEEPYIQNKLELKGLYQAAKNSTSKPNSSLFKQQDFEEEYVK